MLELDGTDTLVGLDLESKRLCHLFDTCWGPSQTLQKDKWVFSERFGWAAGIKETPGFGLADQVWCLFICCLGLLIMIKQ
jgi:hypothetical protein